MKKIGCRLWYKAVARKNLKTIDSPGLFQSRSFLVYYLSQKVSTKRTLLLSKDEHQFFSLFVPYASKEKALATLEPTFDFTENYGECTVHEIIRGLVLFELFADTKSRKFVESRKKERRIMFRVRTLRTSAKRRRGRAVFSLGGTSCHSTCS